jgi:hypothetical protein
MLKYSGFIILALFIAFGIYLLSKSLKLRMKSWKAIKWPTTSATILESSIAEDLARNAMGEVAVGYLLMVKYEYRVNMKTYQGDRVTFGNPSFNFVIASNLVEQYAVGKQVTVSYDPADPSECVLAPKNKVGMLSVIPGIFMIVVGFVVFFISMFM